MALAVAFTGPQASPTGAWAGFIFFWSVAMFDCARSARLSPNESLGEIAAILAAGLLRLDQRAALPVGVPVQGPDVAAAKVATLGSPAVENPPKIPLEGLELSDPARLSVRVG